MEREALAMRKKLLGRDDPLVADSLLSLASAVQYRNSAEAETSMREALAIYQKAWGADDPRLAGPLGWLATLLDVPGDPSKLREAELLARRSVAIARKSSDSNALQLAESLRNLSHALVEQSDKLDEAEDAARESLALNRKGRGNLNPVVTDSLNVLAWVLYRQGKRAESESAARESLAIYSELHPKDWTDGFALNTLCLLDQRAGRWKDAAIHFSQLVEIDPSNGYAHVVLAILLVETGDLSAYRAQCRKMVSMFGASTDPEVMDRVAEACLLAPKGDALDTACQLADRVVTLATNSPYFDFFEMRKGLAEYRLGRFASAVDWILKAVNTSAKAPTDWNFNATAYSILAMAEQQAHHPDKARAALARAVDISRTKMRQLAGGDLGEDAAHWLAAHLFLREAQDLIGPP
jgi:tetratricopeptide (TPR) repeat protein